MLGHALEDAQSDAQVYVRLVVVYEDDAHPVARRQAEALVFLLRHVVLFETAIHYLVERVKDFYLRVFATLVCEFHDVETDVFGENSLGSAHPIISSAASGGRRRFNVEPVFGEGLPSGWAGGRFSPRLTS